MVQKETLDIIRTQARSLLQEETLDIIRTLARYDARLKTRYGIDLNDVGEASAAAWEHLIAASQKGLEPEVAVGQFAKLFGLVSAGSSLFAKTFQCAEMYNKYRLALISYAEENGLFCAGENGPDFHKIVQQVEGVDMYWDVVPKWDCEGRIIGCNFGLYDPVKGVLYEGIDINDALENARAAILKAENSFNQNRFGR